MKGNTEKQPVVGVTGLPCAGKSHVVELLVSGQVTGKPGMAIKADDLGHIVLQQPDVVSLLAQRFGKQIVAEDGNIDRKAVADIVFHNAEELAWLESLLHPRINEEVSALLRNAGGKRLAAVEAALLFAAGLDSVCDLVFVVEAGRDVRLARAAGRGWDERELARREQRLLPLFSEQRLAASPACVIKIENNGPDDRLPVRLAAGLAGIYATKGH